MRRSAATYGDDNFQMVGIGKCNDRMRASGHDFTVKFYCNALAGQVEFLKQLRDAEGGGELALLAIDEKINHGVVLN